MSDPAKKMKVIQVGGQDLVVKELTTGQIRERLEVWKSDTSVSIIDMLFPDRLPADVAAASVGLDIAGLEALDLAPSEMETLLSAAEETNPTFASLVERLAKVGRTHVGQSTAPSAS